jgi:hypothetical protein
LNHLPVNLVDIAVLGVLAISGLVAFSRGLVREVLSIAAWVGAAALTVYAFPHFRDFTRGYIKNELAADIATGVAIFVVLLFVFTAVSHMLSRNVRSSSFGALDRSLGFLFGSARGHQTGPEPEDHPARRRIDPLAPAQGHPRQDRTGGQGRRGDRPAAAGPAGDRYLDPAGAEIGCAGRRSRL